MLQSMGSQKESDTTEQLKNNNKRFKLPKGMSLSELTLAPFRGTFLFNTLLTLLSTLCLPA